MPMFNSNLWMYDTVATRRSQQVEHTMQNILEKALLDCFHALVEGQVDRYGGFSQNQEACGYLAKNA